jgi:aspartyl-tRNA(Asn)/glutamyl-tRNA(Gln) amidotransferase subunit C
MSLTESDIAKIAHLARLEIAPPDVPRYAQELSRVLALVEQMNRVDTAGVEPLAHPLDAVQPLRPDTVTEHDKRAAMQAIAPAVEAGLYLVPRVIE